MRTATIVLVSAALATVLGCEKKAPDTATPEDAAGGEVPATDDVLGGEEGGGEEEAAEEEGGEEAPAEGEGEDEGE